ncbi:hypothetical protein [Variovorax sp. WS11]|uniref:hypothetical protein n=1 Tax=Variovorax sp. WS11 TaxID=1105204 RepID=UPI0011B21827|nr:hypothetical protein [Variovorax sp. WS11]NDZ13579.1 hypothetical protein [Variovorax sp. WS11]
MVFIIRYLSTAVRWARAATGLGTHASSGWLSRWGSAFEDTPAPQIAQLLFRPGSSAGNCLKQLDIH